MSSVLNASVVINYYLESNIFKQKVGYMKKTLTIAREKVLLLRTLLLCTLGTLTATAQAQELTAKNDIIDCGSVLWEHPVTVKFELQNTGRQPLQITRVKPGCDCTTADFPKASIGPGEQFAIEATYDARQLGHFLKDIAVYSNASEKPFYLSIRGVVTEEVVDFSGTYPFTLADAKADLVDVEFDDVNLGDMPVQKIHIMNASTQPISPTVMHLPDYLKATVSPTTIAPNRQGTVTLTLDSKRLRDYGLTQTSVFLGMFPGDKVAPQKEISVSAVLLPAFTELTETQLANAPQMRLSDETIRLTGNKAKQTHAITIENIGKSELDISSLQMFTTGLKVKLNKTRLQPGEQATLKITAETKALRAARSKPRVLMITNDPMKPKVVINIDQ